MVPFCPSLKNKRRTGQILVVLCRSALLPFEGVSLCFSVFLLQITSMRFIADRHWESRRFVFLCRSFIPRAESREKNAPHPARYPNPSNPLCCFFVVILCVLRLRRFWRRCSVRVEGWWPQPSTGRSSPGCFQEALVCGSLCMSPTELDSLKDIEAETLFVSSSSFVSFRSFCSLPLLLLTSLFQVSLCDLSYISFCVPFLFSCFSCFQ